MAITNKSPQLRAARPVVCVAGLSFLLLGACSSQRIGDFTGADITDSASNVLSAILGTTPSTGIDEENARLDPRSPLVLPPDLSIPAPVDGERDTALLTSQWPDDPDERARQEAIEAARLEEEANKRIERRLPGSIANSAPLSREELLAGAVDEDPNYSSADEVLSRQLASRALSPEELLNRRGGSNREPQPPGPPVRDAATQAEGIGTAPSPAPATSRELVVPPNMQDAPPGGVGPSQGRDGVLKRLQFWRRDS